MLTSLQPGSIHFFTGPMCSGKTLELVRNLQIFRLQGIPHVCLRPSLDTRTSKVASRSGLNQDALNVDPNDLTTIRRLIKNARIIGIDEFQLFEPSIIDICLEEIRLGKILLLSGLDTDFRAIPFASSSAVMALPETTIHRFRAVCAVCHEYNATRTQRLRDGQPVSKNESQILIEGADQNVTYEARCLLHHIC